VSADAARSAAETADRTLKQSEAGERPYLVVEPYRKSLQVHAGSPIFINLGYLNWGKTLATNAVTVTTILFGDGASGLVDKYFNLLPKNAPSKQPKIFVIPNPTGELPTPDPVTGAPRSAYITSTSFPIIPNEEAISFISKNEFALFIVGRIWYKDERGGRYRTDFCFFHFLSGAIGNCASHNEPN
jgi:hypothetical protein